MVLSWRLLVGCAVLGQQKEFLDAVWQPESVLFLCLGGLLFFFFGVVLVWTLFILCGFFLFIFLFLFCFCCWDYGGFFWLEDLPFS